MECDVVGLGDLCRRVLSAGRDLMELVRASESAGDVGADVVGADVFFELGLMHEPGRLFTCSTEEEGSVGGVDFVRQAFEGL